MFIVPRDCLPRDEGERARFLARYFQRQVATARDHEQGWCIELHDPGTASFYVDPKIETGLRWWAPPEGIAVSNIPLAVRMEDGFQLAMNDNWTLLSWCCWLKERLGRSGGRPEVVNILHLDSHSDLMSPRISKGNGWVDLITGQNIDLLEPASVTAAIRSGAIGIGSFVVPFFHELPHLNYFHLCVKRHFRHEPGYHAMTPVLEEDDPLFPHARRPRIAFEPSASSNHPKSGFYFLGHDLGDMLAKIPDGPVLLHIDMDYFNNRYDGNPQWKTVTNRHDVDERALTGAIDHFFQSLVESGVADRTEDISIGLSPAFFPAEFWDVAVRHVREGVRLLGRG